MSDIERAYQALVDKSPTYDLMWQYYEGAQPLRYSTERLEEVFRTLTVHFQQNWCACIVDAALDRINLLRFEVSENEAATQRLNELWESTELSLDENDAHTAALVCGESFIVVWPDTDGQVQAYYHDPRLVHLFYDRENPRLKQFAAKWWVADDERRYLTLYYADRLEHYVSHGKSENVSNVAAFEPTDVPVVANPYGIVPVFHLRRERRAIRSELGNITSLQDAVNKLLADMMVAAEFGAFRQRYVISQADPGRLKNAPNEIWALPSGDGAGQQTSVGEFEQTDLSVYLSAIDKLSTSMAVITRTPKHYLYAQGGDPSGEALIAMEAPLNRKVQQYLERFTVAWQQVGTFLLQLSGMTVDPMSVTAVFEPVETIQPLTESIIRQNSVSAGIPLVTQLSREGWTDAELAQMAKEEATARKAQVNSLAAGLLEQQRRFDQGQTEPGRAPAEDAEQ